LQSRALDAPEGINMKTPIAIAALVAAVIAWPNRAPSGEEE
jgi:hypothetical protein